MDHVRGWLDSPLEEEDWEERLDAGADVAHPVVTQTSARRAKATAPVRRVIMTRV